MSGLQALFDVLDTVTVLMLVLAGFGLATTPRILEQLGAGACDSTWWPLYRDE